MFQVIANLGIAPVVKSARAIWLQKRILHGVRLRIYSNDSLHLDRCFDHLWNGLAAVILILEKIDEEN